MMYIKRQSDDTTADNQRSEQNEEVKGICLQDRSSFWCEAEELEGVGSGECLTHGEGDCR